MGEGVEQGDAARVGAERAAPRHVAWQAQLGAIGPGGAVVRGLEGKRDASGAPESRAFARGACLAAGLCSAEDRMCQCGQGRRVHPSAAAASLTASTWPLTRTLRQTSRITPLRSIRKVARSIPM